MSKRMRTGIALMGAEIAKMMEEYASEVTEDMKTAAKMAAKEAVKELKQTSPEREYSEDGKGSSKHYKDGWTSIVETNGFSQMSVRIYNKKKPGLTHLLENSHAKRGGGRVNGIPHIAPAEKKAIADFENHLKERQRK